MTRRTQVNDVIRGKLKEILKDIEDRYVEDWLETEAVITLHVTSDTKEEA